MKELFDLPAPDLEEICTRAATELCELQGSHLLITGGTGFFGKWLVGALASAQVELDLGLQLTVLSRDPAGFLSQYPAAANHPALRFLPGDVTTLEGGKDPYDFILHAAADTLGITTPAREEERARAMVEGTRRMIQLAQESGTRRLLNISSGAVYGKAAAQAHGAREDDYAAAVPLTDYARAKREAEALCVDADLDFVTARAFAFLGPHLPLEAHYAAGNFLRDARRGGPIRVRGDGTALRSYLYPTDLVIWLLRLLVRAPRGRAYNVGSDQAITTGDLARQIARAAGGACSVEIESTEPPGPQAIYLPNLERAHSELDLQIHVPLAEAISRTLTFLRR